MSPASRSKPKDKSSTKAAKEQQKSSSKASVPGTSGNGAPASAYNPLLGTFHTIETAPSVSSPPAHNNGRFRNIDETDEQSRSSVGTGAEYDSVSNNDSCSGESEDQKDKISTTTVRQDIPGCDNDKREKIRQKNERKHQRQRERRAQELHEKCSGYLMSRKLEALAQQLVGMGFNSERATMALILNEGRIEESVAWLFEGGEEAAQQKNANVDSGSNLKIDISEELSRIADLEIMYKCSKQEVERAVVACEGDLEKASESLRAQKQHEPPASVHNKTEDSGGDQPVVNNTGKLAVSVLPNVMKPPAKVMTGPVTIQQRRDDRDFNYTKAAAAAAATVVTSPDSTSRNLQSLRKSQPKSEWARPPQVATAAEKRWPLSGGSSTSVSYSLAPPLQGASPPPAAKVEARYVVVGNEVKNFQTGGAVREPVIMMQRPQSINSKQNSPPATNISTSPPGTAGWYPNHPNSAQSVDMMKSNGGLSYIPNTRNVNNPSNINAQQFYPQSHYQQPYVSNPVVDPSGPDTWGSSWNTTGAQSPSSSLACPSSLGLFSGWGTTGGSGSTSPVDWNNAASMAKFDYSSIDWTLETTSMASKPSNEGWWLNLASMVNNSRMYDSWSANTTPAGMSNPPTMMMRSANSNGGGVCMAAGLQQEGVATTETTLQQGGSSSASSMGTPQHEWTSPFAGKDLFSAPRQFVTSPSL